MSPSGSRPFSICGKECASAEEEFSEDSDLTACSASKSTSKDVRQPVRERSSRDSKLDVGMWSTLDDHLQEKIIAKLPFKSLFQASAISKAWRLRFRSHSFWSEVKNSSSASSWKSYAPLFTNHKKELVGYESSSKRWHILPTHSYLQQDVVQDWSLRAGVGSLLCWTSPTPCTESIQVHVTNPLSRSWKQLPTRPKMHHPDVVHVGWEGGKAYKVVLVTPRIGRVCVQTFDSRDDSWTMDNYNTETEFFLPALGGSAFINGVLYMLVNSEGWTSEHKLISLDVKERIWKEIPRLYRVIGEDQNAYQLMFFHDLYFSEVLVCGSNVMLVVVHRDEVRTMGFHSYDKTLSVFRLDLELGLAFEVPRAPDEMVSGAIGAGFYISAAGQGDCIYIGGRYPPCSVILYDLGTQEWHPVSSATDCLLSFNGIPMDLWEWRSVTYKPGLNPFAEV